MKNTINNKSKSNQPITPLGGLPQNKLLLIITLLLIIYIVIIKGANVNFFIFLPIFVIILLFLTIPTLAKTPSKISTLGQKQKLMFLLTLILTIIIIVITFYLRK